MMAQMMLSAFRLTTIIGQLLVQHLKQLITQTVLKKKEKYRSTLIVWRMEVWLQTLTCRLISILGASPIHQRRRMWH
ncbi:hypothetical protein C493_02623 [Natronolimnohabitans innermongolicus JCM 12255]|uniref:Uncharacterized protein n=1 Tax=Natronolimnohabitans innermongolicus JCM 12255 TaxID=1227499 RepID=L9XHU2_9EURY|nr:hypothetical protein C493_02623 [Natronolimnohabitans innermongolicus JCM 12255]